MIDPRVSTLAVLLSLVPVGLYAVKVIGDTVAAAASAVCVLIIAASLYTIFTGETGDGGGDHGVA